MELPVKVSKALARVLSQANTRPVTTGQGKSKGARRRRAQRSQTGMVPIATSSIVRMGTPRITSAGGNLRIHHREYLGEVNSQSNVNPEFIKVDYYEINPGLQATFPWFSQVARAFESYTINSLSLEYCPSCPSTMQGSVILAPDFDVSDYEPETIGALQTCPGSVRTPAWMPARMTPPAPLFKKLVQERMIRSGAISDVDYKLYDSCCIYVGTTGFSVSTSPGSLWIEYDITIRTPSVNTEPDFAFTQVELLTDQVTKAQPFGSGINIAEKHGGVEPVFTWLSPTSVRFHKPGQYLLLSEVWGTALTNGVPTLNAEGPGSTASTPTGVANAGATYANYQSLLDIVSPSVLSWVSNAAWATVTMLRLKATPYKVEFGV